jgi:GAF domain-containing protein
VTVNIYSHVMPDAALWGAGDDDDQVDGLDEHRRATWLLAWLLASPDKGSRRSPGRVNALLRMGGAEGTRIGQLRGRLDLADRQPLGQSIVRCSPASSLPRTRQHLSQRCGHGFDLEVFDPVRVELLLSGWVEAMSAAADRWARAQQLIAEQPGTDGRSGNVADKLRRICGAAALALSASGTGVSVMTSAGTWGFAVASDASCQHLEELQFTLGEGPCIDAIATNRPVLVADVSDGASGRWPMYTAAVQDYGVRSVFAFPLRTGSESLGVLDVFRTRSGRMTQDDVAQSLTFAEIARITMLDGQDSAGAGAVPEGFDEAPGYRAEVFQAQGMVMVQLGVSLTEALMRIRAYAYAEDRPLADVARDVVNRTLRFDRDQQ